MIPQSDEKDQYHEHQRLALWGQPKSTIKLRAIVIAISVLLTAALALTVAFLVR